MTTIGEALRGNPYPGRLILLARTLGGELTAGYVLTGRSEESRARRIEFSAARELTVVPVSGTGYDNLRHYVAATANERWVVYGNGGQVKEVAARLANGVAPSGALEDLGYEPDPPICTPRITAVVDCVGHRSWFGAARCPEGERRSADTTVVAVGDLAPGQGLMLSTYNSDGDTVFTARRHVDVSIAALDADELLAELWSALDRRFLVAATTFAPLTGILGPIRHA
jgi:IMP cyclohydrolase